MAGSTFGNQFKIMTWGESHGAGVGVVIDGCPAGIPLAESDIQVMLNKRKPGQSKYTTPRKEDDEVEILSGIFEGKTTGTPISMVVRNKTQRSADYSEIARFYRPGHADLHLMKNMVSGILNGFFSICSLSKLSYEAAIPPISLEYVHMLIPSVARILTATAPDRKSVV